MKFLIVSEREYSKTNRGIDVITAYLAEKNNIVDHLLFYCRRKIPGKQINKNIRQLYFYDSFGLYRNKMKYFLPGILLRLYFSFMIKKQTEINFTEYDFIILESGHSIYLSLVISGKIIYRQSDSTEVAFNSNRVFYTKLEQTVIKKAFFVLSALPSRFYMTEYAEKTIYWHSGFSQIPYIETPKIKKAFVYMGGGEIDFGLIKKIANKYHDYLFHIVGAFHKRKLGNNIILHGYLKFDEYHKIIFESSIYIIPISKRFSYQARKNGFTAKIFLAMSLGMPILIKNHGAIQESDLEKKFFVYKTHKEALLILGEIIEKVENGELNSEVSKSTQDFLFPHTVENRLKELDNIFQRILK